MKTPCIITVAITGSLPQKRDNPAVPITIQGQIESTQQAFDAGAALVHLRVRNDDGSPSSSSERFATVLEGIRKHCPGMIVQFSTGGRSGAGRERGLIQDPLHGQFVMGIRNAMRVDREVFEFYVRTLQRLAPGSTWTGAGIGQHQMTLARWSLELGGQCRTGMEDKVRLDRDTLAPSNAALVQQVVRLCQEAGRPVATPGQARALLGIKSVSTR